MEISEVIQRGGQGGLGINVVLEEKRDNVDLFIDPGRDERRQDHQDAHNKNPDDELRRTTGGF